MYNCSFLCLWRQYSSDTSHLMSRLQLTTPAKEKKQLRTEKPHTIITALLWTEFGATRRFFTLDTWSSSSWLHYFVGPCHLSHHRLVRSRCLFRCITCFSFLRSWALLLVFGCVPAFWQVWNRLWAFYLRLRHFLQNSSLSLALPFLIQRRWPDIWLKLKTMDDGL